MGEISKIGSVTMTSLELVEMINLSREDDEAELKHNDFLKKVPKVLGEEGLGNFSQTYKHPQNGQEYPCYRFPKREACLMAMSYSYELQAKVYDRMTELEQEKPKLPQTYLEALKELVAVTEVVEQQAKKIEQDKPLVMFAETVTNSTDCIAVGDLAKIVADQKIKIGRNKLFQWLRDNEYLMNDNKPYQKYVDQGLFRMIEQSFKTAYGDKVGFKTLVTGKGQVVIVEKLREIFGKEL